MTTSRPIAALSKPTNADPIPEGTLGYFRARNRGRIYELVLKEFQCSGLTQADLGRRMKKGPDVICRLLGAPGNWTLDTVSDLLFAISGAEANYAVSYPLERPKRNFAGPDWLLKEPIPFRADASAQSAAVGSSTFAIASVRRG